MPTIAEIKAQLKERGIKGTTGKNKAELMAMLGTDAVPKRKRPQVAPAAPEVPKRKRPLVASKVKEQQLEVIKSFGHWVWRRFRFDGDEIKGEDYKTGANALRVVGGAQWPAASLSDVKAAAAAGAGASFTVKNVKKMYPGYWEEWASIIGKTLVTPNINVKITNDGDIKISKLFQYTSTPQTQTKLYQYTRIPQTPYEIDKAFTSECFKWWEDPTIPTVK